MPRVELEQKKEKTIDQKKLYKYGGIGAIVLAVLIIAFLIFSPWPDAFNNWNENSDGKLEFSFVEKKVENDYFYQEFNDYKCSAYDILYNFGENYKNQPVRKGFKEIKADNVYVLIYAKNEDTEELDLVEKFIESVNLAQSYSVEFYIVEVNGTTNQTILDEFGITATDTPSIVEFHGSSKFVVHNGKVNCNDLFKKLNNYAANGKYEYFTVELGKEVE